MSGERKTIEQLLSERNEHRKMLNRVYVHTKSGQKYQLIGLCHTEATNELMAYYCLTAMSQLQFVRPINEFIEKFEESK